MAIKNDRMNEQLMYEEMGGNVMYSPNRERREMHEIREYILCERNELITNIFNCLNIPIFHRNYKTATVNTKAIHDTYHQSSKHSNKHTMSTNQNKIQSQNVKTNTNTNTNINDKKEMKSKDEKESKESKESQKRKENSENDKEKNKNHKTNENKKDKINEKKKRDILSEFAQIGKGRKLIYRFLISLEASLVLCVCCVVSCGVWFHVCACLCVWVGCMCMGMCYVLCVGCLKKI